MVSPVRIRVPPLLKVLQMAEKIQRVDVAAETPFLRRVNSRIEIISLLASVAEKSPYKGSLQCLEASMWEMGLNGPQALFRHGR
jgi:hypothetical protein